MLKSPLFKDLVINGTNGKDGKDGKSAIVTVDKDGNLVVKNGADGRDGLNGLDGTSGENGRDGLTKIVTEKDLKDGTSGTMVYTDKDGNELVKDGSDYYKKSDVENLVKVDGKYYNAADVVDGEVQEGKSPVNVAKVGKDTIAISTVNPDGTTTTATVIRNVASSLTPAGTSASESEAKGIAAKLTDAGTPMDVKDLNKAVTVGDLKTIALAGLDFAGNDGEVIHRNLGTKLNIQGGADYITQAIANERNKGVDPASHVKVNTTEFSGENIATHKDGETLRIEMLKSPSFKDLVLNGANGKDGKTSIITVDKDGNLVVKNGTDGRNGLNGLDGATGANGRDGFSKIITEKDLQGGTSGTNGADGLDGKSIVDKVNALRDGLSGPMVYTEEDGSRIVKHGDNYYSQKDIDKKISDERLTEVDGKYYAAGQFETGTHKLKDNAVATDLFNGLNAVDKDNIRISAVNTDELTEVAITLGNTKGIIREAMKEFEDTDVVIAETTVKKAKEAVTEADKVLTAAKDALTTAKNNFMSDASAANRQAYFDAMGDVSNKTKDLKAKKEALAVAETKFKPEAVGKAETAIATAQTALTNANNALTAARKTLDEAQTAFEKNPTDANIQTALETAINDLATKEATRKNALNDLKEKKLALDKAKEDAIANEKVLLAQNAVKDKLLKAEGKDINTVATVGDLQAVAVAGLDFEGNTGEAIHKNLGEKLNIEGKEKAVYDPTTYSSDNLVTYNDEDTLRVAMLKNPKFNTVTLSDGKHDVTLGVDGENGIGIKGKDGKVDKFVTETKLEGKLQGTGFKVKVTDGDGNSQDLDVKLGDTVEFKNTDKNIVLKGTPGTGTSTSGGTTTGGTSGGTAGGSTGGSTTGGTSGTSGTSEHTVDINLAKDLKVDNIKVANKVEAKEVVADKVTTKEIVTEKLTTDKFETNELKVGTVVIKNGEITGIKTAELDESGHVAKEDEGKLVNGGTLNKTIDNLRAENAQFREGVQGAIQQNSQRISKLETKVNKGLANAAAMAGINFMEIGVNQATVGAAVGGYEGTQAVAVGVQAAPTQDLRINAKVSLTPGSHSSSMYSVGASWRFDLK